ncbi:glycosyl hydrolase [Prolixibacter sp. SD074]|uniref:glycosyl hydrolase n=1 Tax=Prolixibacter sp. SD074 TaxID=2652391 RepID=UPI00128805FE|nr:glycosyl hydrolase [Prolixibacter sp. SD074]GET28749.1 mannan endo-1,4-beta-mannosidase [Prolixibacter sp. SD074]
MNILPSFLTFLLLFLFAGAINAQTTYEAENVSLSSGLSVQTSILGYSGTGYVGNFSNDNDQLTFVFSITTAGYYDISLGVATPYGEKTNDISINGNTTSFTVAQSDAFQEISIGKVRLNEGQNEINIIKNWGWFYVDYLKIVPNNDPAIEFNLTGQLVNPNASDNTKRLYQFLLDNFQKKIISGTMTLNSFDETDWLKEQTGKEPSLIGIDFMHCNRGYTWYDDMTPTNDAKAWYDKNGIPAMCWHWRDPSRLTEEFYTDNTNFDVSKIFDENSAEYQEMLSDIDYISGLLKNLADDDVPVLWRPLHEASGGWFWWGAKGPDACKKLWQIMYDRMVNYHHLNNLIWVWTTDANPNNMDWYPGDAYVDILGVDIYANQGDFSSQYLTFDKIKTDFAGTKMVTLSECGIVPDPDKLQQDEAGWSYFMTWYGDFVEDGTYNPLSHWEKVMNSDYVITLDEMPDLKTYVTSSVDIPLKNGVNFQCFVDPTQRQLKITLQNYQGDYLVKIYNLTGTCFFNQKITEGAIYIPLADLPPGILLVSISTQSQRFSFKVRN